MVNPLKRFEPLGLALTASIAVSACSQGNMSVKQQYFLTAELDGNAVHYRVNIRANTVLSDAKFRQGWFPAEAVDSVFSEATGSDAGSTYDTRDKLKRQINTTLLELRKRYGEELLKAAPDGEKLTGLLLAENRLRYYAAREIGDDYDFSETMEFDPISGLITNRSGDKLVLILSANPDQIIQSIANFSEEEKTKAVIKGLVDFIGANARKDLDKKEALAEVERQRNIRAGLLIDAMLPRIDPANPDRQAVLANLEALRSEISGGLEQ